VVGFMGATESLFIMILIHLACFVHPASNALLAIPFEILGLQITLSHLILGGVFLSGIHYNVENIYYGFVGAPDKLYAFYCLIPYL